MKLLSFIFFHLFVYAADASRWWATFGVQFMFTDILYRSAALKVVPGVSPSLTISYPQTTLYLSRAASLHARVAQPRQAKDLDTPSTPHFRLHHEALNVTSVSGIVYVSNTTALQRAASSLRVQVEWTDRTGRVDRAKLTVELVEASPCVTHDHLDNLCSALTQRECGRTTCAYGLGSLSGPGGETSGPRCQWIANTSRSGLIPGYATCTVDPSTCPDQWCDPLERLSHNLTCLQDCTQDVLGAGKVRTEQGYGVRPLIASAFCSCDHFRTCSCIGLAPASPVGPRKVNPSSGSSVTTSTQTSLVPSPQSVPDSRIRRKEACGFKCQTKAAIGIIFIMSSCLFLLLFLSTGRQRDKVSRELVESSNILLRTLESNGLAGPDTQLSTPIPPDPRWEFPRASLIIQQSLGEGEFGRVMKATARDIGGIKGETIVAVKTLKVDGSSAELAVLMSEYHMMRDVSHPNVIRLLGVCTGHGGPIYLIIEYAEHGSLGSFLRRSRVACPDRTASSATAVQPISYKTLLGFAWQIAKGMSYLAENKLVHRDLAARNVLLATGYICKISDFGLSRDVYEDDAYHKQSNGRVPVKWMALESLSDHVYTTRSDIWSFGVVLWELVTLGCTPYPGIVVHNLFHLLNAGYRMEKPLTCTDSLYQIMISCWQKDPLERPPFTQITDSLEKILEEGEDYLPLLLEKRLVINPGYDADSTPEKEFGSPAEAFVSKIHNPAEVIKYVNQASPLKLYENDGVAESPDPGSTYDRPLSLGSTNGLQMCYKSQVCSFNNLGSRYYKNLKTRPQSQFHDDTININYHPTFSSKKPLNYENKNIGFVEIFSERKPNRPLSEYISMNTRLGVVEASSSEEHYDINAASGSSNSEMYQPETVDTCFNNNIIQCKPHNVSDRITGSSKTNVRNEGNFDDRSIKSESNNSIIECDPDLVRARSATSTSNSDSSEDRTSHVVEP